MKPLRAATVMVRAVSSGRCWVAHGAVIDPSNITVTFPDDGHTFTGKLVPPGTISRSNGTTWTKA